MGSYAELKINQTIDYINHMRRSNTPGDTLTTTEQENNSLEARGPLSNGFAYHRKLISIIDEPLLKNKLKDMLAEVDPAAQAKHIKEKIDALQVKYLELTKSDAKNF